MLEGYIHLGLQSPRNEHPLPALIASILIAGLLLFAIARRPRTKLIRLFYANFIFTEGWVFGIYQLNMATTGTEGLFWVRALNIAAVPIAPTLFHFISELTDTAGSRLNRITQMISYGICILIMTVGPFSIFVPGTTPAPGFFFYPRFGPAFCLYLLLFVILIPWSLLKLIRASRNDSPVRNQSRYALLGYALSYAGGLQTFLPALGLPYWPYGLNLVPMGIGFIWYAVVARQLLAFSVVIRKTLIYSVVTALLTAVYVAVVFILAAVVQNKVSSAPAASSYAVAAIVITLLFHPLRMRIQRWVDRRFFHVLLDDRFVQELTSGFVHELKRPLAMIVMPAELALMDIKAILRNPKSAEEVLPKTEQRLAHIVAAAMDASHRIDAVRELNSTQGQSAEPLALQAILIKALNLQKMAMQEAGVELKHEVPDTLPMLVGHSHQLELVFMNLLTNAIEAMEQSPIRQLLVTGGRHANHVWISIADSGPGISVDRQARVFEPYFTTKAARGMGMGLYLSQQVVKAHGGAIHVKSAALGGAEFIVDFPVSSSVPA